MAVKLYNKSFIKLFLSLVLCIIIGNAAKLTVPRILLPYNTGVATNYTLEVREGGCYKWSSSRYDLVTVTPLPSEREVESCTTKAIVSAVSRYPERDNAIILAEDEKSGQVLRCDVVIDALDAIEIVTTTRVLFLEDAPEVFEVIAKNDQGDTFSSLEGVAFQWALDSDAFTNDVYGVLRFLKFADSVYKTPPAIEYWEKQNMHGSMILMEGSKTGSAKVTVKPSDHAYKHIKSYVVSLVIVANLNLKPSHIYLLPGTQVKYHLELIKQGKVFPVSLPSEQYYLEVVNGSVAVLDTKTSTVTALSLGSTNIVVKDRYISGREIAYLPSAIVHVTVPSYMTLSILPGDKWSLQEEKNYFVSVNIYDRNSYPIHITEHVSVAVQFPPKFFKVMLSSQNGTYQEVYTLMPGSCQITATLLGVKENGVLIKLETPVTATQDVTIYKKIHVMPEFIFLPWDPITKPSYSVFLTASGGTGSYNWMSSMTSIATVQQVSHENEQKAHVTTFGQGEVAIKATDVHISLFSGSAQVSVQNAAAMKILPHEVEIQLNGTLVLPFAMYGFPKIGKDERLMFSDCTQLPITVDIDEIPKFEYIKDDGVPSTATACRNLHLKCLSMGYNRIRVRYERDDISLKDAVIVACYKVLKAIHPEREAVVALGSSIEVAFEGGPRPWPTCKGGYFAELSSQKSVVNIFQQNTTDSPITGSQHAYHVICKGNNEADIQLTVGNKPCPSNLYPVSNKASAKITCAIPQSVVIKPIVSILNAKKCPAPDDDAIAIDSSQDIQLELIVKDNLGRRFYNISSLDIKWYLSDKKLASLRSYEGVETTTFHKMIFRKIDKNYQELHPNGLEGNLKVTAVITGYKPNVLKQYDIQIKPELPTPITYTLSLNLVEEAEVLPKRISVFNNPSNKAYFNITKGSGHFYVEASDTSKAKVTYRESTHQVEVIPLDTGSFTVTVIDLCLPMKQEAVAHVQIYGISAILLDVVDKVELGKTITASVEVLNEDKQNIPASVFTLMNLQPILATSILSVRLASQPGPDHSHAMYHVNGLSLGTTTLKFTTSATSFKGQQYSSEAYPIQVFPPLRVNPSNITLVVGASFQVLCMGGPHPQSNIEFSVEETEKAIVSTGGRVEAKTIGKTILVARSVGHDKKGHPVVFSQDKATIHIVLLQRIKINAPLTRMIAESEMPVYAVGLSDQETPFAFGSSFPRMKYKWSVSNEKVVSVNDVYQDVGIQENEENNFRVRIKAQQDGHVTLRLEVTSKVSSRGDRTHVLSDEVQIQVFKKLKLTNPEFEDGMILLSPNSQLKLKCNRFGPAKVSYSITPPEGDNSISHVAKVDGQGLLVATSKTGTAVLLVTAIEDFGITQQLTVIVKVEEVTYMMIKPTIEVKTRDWPLLSIPVGFTVPFVVSYHDNIGRVFNAVRSQLKYRANRLDFARISFGTRNDSLIVQVLKPGYTVLKVWDSESYISPDYIRISAGNAIDPTDMELIVGDVICFGSPLLTHEGHTGTWTSESHNLVVHPSSGGAVALSAGTTTITYSLSDEFSTSTQVTVLPADSISLTSGNLFYITNVEHTKPYRIPVIIQSSAIHRLNNVVGRNCSMATEISLPLPYFRTPFSCEISFNTSYFDVKAIDVFHAESGFDIEEGMYYCNIFAVNKAPLIEISALEAHLLLSVQPLALGQGLLFSAKQLELPFFPAFTVLNEELILSSIQSSAALIISASSAVQNCIEVVPSDKNVLEVMAPVRKASAITYPIQLLDSSFFIHGDQPPLHLDIMCHKTKQHIKLPVRFKMFHMQPETGHCLVSQYDMFDWHWIFTVIAAVVVIFVSLYVCRSLVIGRRGTVTTQPVFLNSSDGQMVFTPTQGSGLHISSGSPGRMFSPQGSPPFHGRHSPQDTVYESLGRQARMWSLDSTHQVVVPRRRPVNNVFS